jgi:hypothetical protein
LDDGGHAVYNVNYDEKTIKITRNNKYCIVDLIKSTEVDSINILKWCDLPYCRMGIEIPKKYNINDITDFSRLPYKIHKTWLNKDQLFVGNRNIKLDRQYKYLYKGCNIEIV